MRTDASRAVITTKSLTGILGFDEITSGGLPRGRTTLVMGGPGCGKTVFALQTLVNGVRRKEAGLFVAFEESVQQIISNAATFEWDVGSLRNRKLFFLDACVSPEVVKAGDFDLSGVLALLEAKVGRVIGDLSDTVQVLLVLGGSVK